jgi:hypothetical protein
MFIARRFTVNRALLVFSMLYALMVNVMRGACLDTAKIQILSHKVHFVMVEVRRIVRSIVISAACF